MEKNEYIKMFNFENDYWWYRGLHELVLDCIRKCDAVGPLKILDAGCGTGRMMQLLNGYGSIEGIDYSSDAISFCHKRGLHNSRVQDLNGWNPPSEEYNVIISLDVVCCTGVENDMNVIGKFYKALKSQGILILNLPSFDCLSREHDIAVFIKKRYLKEATLSDLRKIGFTIKKATYRLPLLFAFIILKKYVFKTPVSKLAQSDLKPLPSLVNKFMLFINRIENKMIRNGTSLPCGSSLFIVCTKV